MFCCFLRTLHHGHGRSVLTVAASCSAQPQVFLSLSNSRPRTLSAPASVTICHQTSSSPHSLCPPSILGGQMSRGLSRNHYPVTHSEYPIFYLFVRLFWKSINIKEMEVFLFKKTQSFRLISGIPYYFSIYIFKTRKTKIKIRIRALNTKHTKERTWIVVL